MSGDLPTCGAKCPDHGEPCSVVAPPEMGGPTIEDHRERLGPHFCAALVATGGKPHSWTGEFDPRTEKGRENLRARALARVVGHLTGPLADGATLEQIHRIEAVLNE